MKHDINYFHIKYSCISEELFATRSECYAFLNIWRTYTEQNLQTCAYAVAGNSFECVVATRAFGVHETEKIKAFLQKMLVVKMRGLWPEKSIIEMSENIRVTALLSEKECVYKVFDIHTLPQRNGSSTDYRTYPFSSYRALASQKTTMLAKPVVWQWFGGRMRFTAFHQAYAGWMPTKQLIA
jgi:putative transposase